LSDKRKNDVTVDKVTRPAPKLVWAVVAMGDKQREITTQNKTTKSKHDYWRQCYL